MYQDFFQLRDKPFELLPNPDYLYSSQSHRKALGYLRYGILERVGFILLTGEVGAGKTTLIRNLIRELKGDYAVSMVLNTLVTPLQLLAMINEDFGLQTAGKDKVALLKDLNEFLLDQCAKGCQPIVVIDEAQNLDLDTLEEIRLLSNLEAPDQKLLQTILVGQPELMDNISLPEMRQLRQRIAVNCHLRPLALDETRDYILFRLEKAGNRDAVQFDERAFEVIHQHSQGIPRLINVICEFILLSAYVEGKKAVDFALAEQVAEEVGLDFTPRETGNPKARSLSSRFSEDVLERLNALEQGVSRLATAGGSRPDLLERYVGRLVAAPVKIAQRVSGSLKEIEKRLIALEERIAALERRDRP